MSVDTNKPARFRSPVCEPGHRKGVPNPTKGKHLAVEPLKDSEVLALMRACNNGVGGKRNRAALAIMWRTGCRVGELVALRPVDVDPETRTVRIRGGKTKNADRTIGVDRECLRLVAEWREARLALGVPPTAPLFCTIVKDRLGYPWTTAQVRNMVRNVAKRAGLEKRCHPHGFRHSFACDFMQECKDLRLLSKALGHANFGVTQTYIDHVYNGDVVEAMATRLWSFDQPAPQSAKAERIDSEPLSAYDALERLGAV